MYKLSTGLCSKSLLYRSHIQNNKSFFDLEIETNILVTSDKDILSECESSYNDLYTSKLENYPNLNFFQQANETFLGPDEQKVCDGLLTKTECTEAFKKSTNSDRTPGTDGLPAEFYKFFWNDISTRLLSALNFVYESDC